MISKGTQARDKGAELVRLLMVGMFALAFGVCIGGESGRAAAEIQCRVTPNAVWVEGGTK